MKHLYFLLLPAALIFLTFTRCQLPDNNISPLQTSAKNITVNVICENDKSESRSLIDENKEHLLSDIRIALYEKGNLSYVKQASSDKKADFLIYDYATSKFYAVANMPEFSFPEKESMLSETIYKSKDFKYIDKHGIPMSGTLSGMSNDKKEFSIIIQRLMAKFVLSFENVPEDVSEIKIEKLEVSGGNGILCPFNPDKSITSSYSGISEYDKFNDYEENKNADLKNKHDIYLYINENAEKVNSSFASTVRLKSYFIKSGFKYRIDKEFFALNDSKIKGIYRNNKYIVDYGKLISEEESGGGIIISPWNPVYLYSAQKTNLNFSLKGNPDNIEILSDDSAIEFENTVISTTRSFDSQTIVNTTLKAKRPGTFELLIMKNGTIRDRKTIVVKQPLLAFDKETYELSEEHRHLNYKFIIKDENGREMPKSSFDNELFDKYLNPEAEIKSDSKILCIINKTPDCRDIIMNADEDLQEKFHGVYPDLQGKFKNSGTVEAIANINVQKPKIPELNLEGLDKNWGDFPCFTNYPGNHLSLSFFDPLPNFYHVNSYLKNGMELEIYAEYKNYDGIPVKTILKKCPGGKFAGYDALSTCGFTQGDIPIKGVYRYKGKFVKEEELGYINPVPSLIVCPVARIKDVRTSDHDSFRASVETRFEVYDKSLYDKLKAFYPGSVAILDKILETVIESYEIIFSNNESSRNMIPGAICPKELEQRNLPIMNYMYLPVKCDGSNLIPFLNFSEKGLFTQDKIKFVVYSIEYLKQ